MSCTSTATALWEGGRFLCEQEGAQQQRSQSSFADPEAHQAESLWNFMKPEMDRMVSLLHATDLTALGMS